MPFLGGWAAQAVAWPRGSVALLKIRAARQCPPSATSGHRHEEWRSLQSGNGQGSGGQERRRRGSEKPCQALEAGKPSESRGGQEGILLSPPAFPPGVTHTGRAPGRGGGEEGTSRTAPGKNEESNPVH